MYKAVGPVHFPFHNGLTLPAYHPHIESALIRAVKIAPVQQKLTATISSPPINAVMKPKKTHVLFAMPLFLTAQPSLCLPP